MPIHAVRFRIRNRSSTEGTRNELRMIRMYKRGMDPHNSVRRCPIRSIQPPKNPWMPPMMHPRKVPVTARERPKIMEIRNP